jgi:hypothetical protein
MSASRKTQLRKLESIVKKLRQAQEQAASIEFTLGNGGFLDSILGGVADEIDTLIRVQKAVQR